MTWKEMNGKQRHTATVATARIPRVVHSQRLTRCSTTSATPCLMVMIFPIHLVQKKTVAALPYARMMVMAGLLSTNALRVMNLLMIMPKGARNMPAIPVIMIAVNLGRRMIR